MLKTGHWLFVQVIQYLCELTMAVVVGKSPIAAPFAVRGD
jgi:hypothetical protein